MIRFKMRTIKVRQGGIMEHVGPSVSLMQFDGYIEGLQGELSKVSLEDVKEGGTQENI